MSGEENPKPVNDDPRWCGHFRDAESVARPTRDQLLKDVRANERR